MDSQPSNLCFLIVPGGFHVPDHFELFLAALQHRGHEAIAIQNLSTGTSLTGRELLRDDGANLRRITLDLIEQGKRVVAVAFSYGGMVATQGFVQIPLSINGEAGLVKTIFVSSTMPDAGQAVLTFVGGQIPPSIIIHGNSTTTYKEDEKIAQFYFDVPEAVALEAAQKMAPQSLGCFSDPATNEAWTNTPCGYVVCTEDKAFPAAAQRAHVESRRERSKYPIVIEELPAGHSPFLSMPERLAETCEKISATAQTPRRGA